MSRPFVVRETEGPRGRPRYRVVNLEDDGRPVADFDDREAAREHAEKLNAGPLDWDEQEAWQEDDWGEGDWSENWGAGGAGS